MSSLSVSSGSSLGSLGSLSTGSKGSLSSLSFTDIYSSCSQFALPEVNLVELHRRVEKLLQGHQPLPQNPPTQVPPLPPISRSQSAKSLSPGSSLSSLSPPVSPYEVGPPPSYAQHIQRQQRQPSPGAGVAIPSQSTFSVSPIQEVDGDTLNEQMGFMNLGDQSVTNQPANDQNNFEASLLPPEHLRRLLGDDGALPPLSPISEGSHCGVSAAVSDESVAGDSGVFEAAYKR